MVKKFVEMSKNVSAYEAAEYLGCSYPHLIHLIKKNKIKAQKIRKQWFVDLSDLERAKNTHLVSPRPRASSSSSAKSASSPQAIFSTTSESTEQATNSIELRLVIPKGKYELINSALLGGNEKTLKQHLETKIDELFVSITNQFKSLSL